MHLVKKTPIDLFLWGCVFYHAKRHGHWLPCFQSAPLLPLESSTLFSLRLKHQIIVSTVASNHQWIYAAELAQWIHELAFSGANHGSAPKLHSRTHRGIDGMKKLFFFSLAVLDSGKYFFKNFSTTSSHIARWAYGKDFLELAESRNVDIRYL